MLDHLAITVAINFISVLIALRFWYKKSLGVDEFQSGCCITQTCRRTFNFENHQSWININQDLIKQIISHAYGENLASIGDPWFPIPEFWNTQLRHKKCLFTQPFESLPKVSILLNIFPGTGREFPGSSLMSRAIFTEWLVNSESI